MQYEWTALLSTLGLSVEEEGGKYCWCAWNGDSFV